MSSHRPSMPVSDDSSGRAAVVLQAPCGTAGGACKKDSGFQRWYEERRDVVMVQAVR